MGIAYNNYGDLLGFGGTPINWTAPGVYEQDFHVPARTNDWLYYYLSAGCGNAAAPVPVTSQNVVVEFTNLSLP